MVQVLQVVRVEEDVLLEQLDELLLGQPRLRRGLALVVRQERREPPPELPASGGRARREEQRLLGLELVDRALNHPQHLQLRDAEVLQLVALDRE